MEVKKVKDIMVKLDEYACVPDDATLYEAVAALEAAQEAWSRNHYRHRAILVCLGHLTGGEHNVIGKISQRDVIKGLEPGYKQAMHDRPKGISQFTQGYIKALQDRHGLWSRPLDDICSKGGRTKVKDIMSEPVEGDFVDAEVSLNRACHQFVMSHHQSLLVTSGGKVVGVLRLCDVFDEIYQAMKACELPTAVD